MKDSEWIELQREERLKIMESLDAIDKELKKLIKKLEHEPQIDAGYKRKLEMVDKLYARRLGVVNTKLANLANKAELEHALEQIKKEVEAIVKAEERAYSVADVRAGKG